MIKDSLESQRLPIATKGMFDVTYIKYWEKKVAGTRKMDFGTDEMFTLGFTKCDNVCRFIQSSKMRCRGVKSVN